MMITSRIFSLCLSIYIALLSPSNASQSRIISNTMKWKQNLNIHYVHSKSKSTSNFLNSNEETSKDPLVLLPGFGVGTFHYDRNIEVLSNKGDIDVYSLDLLGQGKSWPDHPATTEDHLCYSVDTWSDEIIHFIDTIIRKPVILGGNSLGGYLSLCVAYKRPDLVKSIILINAAPFWAFNPPDKPDPRSRINSEVFNDQHNTDNSHITNDGNKDSDSSSNKKKPFIWNGYLPAPPTLLYFGTNYFNKLRQPDIVDWFLRTVYKSPGTWDNKLIDGIITSASNPKGPEAFTSILFSPKFPVSFDEMLASIQVPVCLIMGRNDPWIVPYWAQRAKRVRPSTCYIELSPAGHCPHHECPNTVNQLILKWLHFQTQDSTATATAIHRDNDVLIRKAVEGVYEEEEGRQIEVKIKDGKSTSFMESIFEWFEPRRQNNDIATSALATNQ